MNICICGAGQVGKSLVAQLSKDNEITVIDTSDEQLGKLAGSFEVNTITGSAACPTVLSEAGIKKSDMLVAVTSSDEVNLIACQLGHHLLGITNKVARVRNEQYQKFPSLQRADGGFAVDMMINPSALVTQQIELMTQYPSALQVMDFANGRVKLVAIRANEGSPLVGHRIRELRDHIPHVHVRIAAVYRQGRPLTPHSDTVIEDNDEVFFIAERNDIRRVMAEMRQLDERNKNIFIAGGGTVGTKLALSLDKGHRVTVFESDKRRCELLAQSLKNGIVINSSAADQRALSEESVEKCDIFCALTNNDEANLLSGLMAKHLGAKKNLVLLNNHLYNEIIHQSDIDVDLVLEPHEITLGRLLSYIRRGAVARVHSLHNGAAEAIEAIADQRALNANIIGKPYKQLPLPHGTTLGAVVRGKHVHTGFSSLTVEDQDHIIFFVIDKRSIPRLEDMFRVD